jgi:hypothetical protein
LDCNGVLGRKKSMTNSMSQRISNIALAFDIGRSCLDSGQSFKFSVAYDARSPTMLRRIFSKPGSTPYVAGPASFSVCLATKSSPSSMFALSASSSSFTASSSSSSLSSSLSLSLSLSSSLASSSISSSNCSRFYTPSTSDSMVFSSY